jgi:poly-gamma-glutamate synthesis protein (capsule biosynthesis protein)
LFEWSAVRIITLICCAFVLLLGVPVYAATPVILSFTGDCTLGSDDNFGYDGTLPAVIASHNGDFGYIFRNVFDVFASDDLTVINLEGTFTASCDRQPKQFAFKGPASYARFLSCSKIEAANLANNHTYDYGEQGFRDTLSALNAEKISYFGDGIVNVCDIRGTKVGLLGYYEYDGDELLARMEKEIFSLKAAGAFVVASFHWGQEGHYHPDGNQQYFAHKAIDLGADVIIGHHPHVLQGLEIYHGRLIAYSLGNFAFGGNMDPYDKRTLILQLRVDPADTGCYAARILPARVSSVEYVNNYQPTLYNGWEKEDFFKWFWSISPLALRDEWTLIR